MNNIILKNSILLSVLLSTGLAISGCAENKPKDLKLMTDIKAENSIAKESSMWEVFEEDYTDPNSGLVFNSAQGIRRKDGFSLLNTKISHEDYMQTFICKGEFGEFSFYAIRWNGRDNKPSETYRVLIGGAPDGVKMDKVTRRKFILTYAKDIEAALKSFPLGQILNTPVKEVVFDISLDPRVPELIHAEEI